MSQGIQVLNHGTATFDSTKGHLLVDPNANPSHFQIVTITGNPLTNTVPNVPVSEVLLQVPHKLPYTPFVDAYFFLAGAAPNNPDQYFQLTDSYYHYFFSYVNVGSLLRSDVTIKVDDVNLTVTHTYNNVTGTGTDSPVPIKMKYTIFSNQGYPQF